MIKIKVSKGAKIRNRYNQVPHLTQTARTMVLIMVLTIYIPTGLIKKDLRNYLVACFYAFISSADLFFQNIFSSTFISGTLFECQTIWTHGTSVIQKDLCPNCKVISRLQNFPLTRKELILKLYKQLLSNLVENKRFMI